MQSTTTLELNLQYPNHATTMYAVQNDRLTRKISAVLVDGTAAWTPPVGTEAIVRYMKPDGTQGFYDRDENNNIAVIWTGNVATIILAEQALTVAGNVLCQVNFYNTSEEKLTTFSWVIKVQPSVLTDETIVSTDYFNVLTQQISTALAITAYPPYISDTTHNWMIYDTEQEQYVDSGISAQGIQGEQGPQGISISSVTKKSGTGAGGSVDVYNVNLNNGTVAGTFNVYNGADGQGSPGSATPLMDGTASTGSAIAYSREDHVHPSDTSRVPTTRKVNGKALSADVTVTPEDITYNGSQQYSSGTLGKVISDLVLESTFDSADRTSEIVSLLTNNKKCILGSGTFYTTGIDMPDGSSLIGMGDATILHKTGSGTYVVNMNKNNTVSNLCIDGNNTVTSTTGTHHGILWNGNYSTSSSSASQPQNGKLSDLTIKNCDGGGITCNNTGPSRYNNLIASNIAINNCNVGINIPFYSEYHRFTNVDAFECYYGCINNGGNNCFVNCDFSDSKAIGFVIDNSNNDKTNNSHGTAVGCSFNHIANNAGLAISLNGVSNGYTFGNCNIFRGSVEIINSTGVEITDSLFGTSLTITISGSKATIFADDIFQGNPTVTNTNSPDTYFRHCLNYTTGGYIPESDDVERRIDSIMYASVFEAYYSVSDLATYMSTKGTGSVVIARMASTAASAFFESGTAKPTVLYLLKGGSTNAYFLAVTQGEASIGNLNVSTGQVNILHDLATTEIVGTGTLTTTAQTLIPAVNELYESINSITIRSVTHTYSANAGSNANTNLKTLIDNDLPSGYSFLAIAGYGSGNANVVVYSARYANNNYSLGLKNVGTSAVSDSTAEIYYLCIKR